ncbi:MAG: hypothetical protein A2156_08375 [Deltaproteobacteria bacterium RBG_16_48_10]|nr:MAG: hypothetical protein A2156_08375 [Deltaproteobacteria bacterium RBG_16_48_10]
MLSFFIVHFYQIMIMETILIKKRFLEDFISGSARIFYHIALAALSAAIALSLPWILNLIAEKILVYWSIFGNEKLLVVSIEMAVAILLVFFFNVIGRSWRDRRLSNMARDAGLVLVKPVKGFFSRRRIKKLKERQGFAKDVLVIGSTGFRTFVDSKGDLHEVIQNCRKAWIMLLNPFSEGARARARSILDPQVTSETFREQIKRSIAFLRGLKSVNKEVKLKLYYDAPLLKLTILDDHIWIQHYHAGLDVQRMPEYVFKHDQNLSSLYIPFYQYFMTRWNDPNVPEYDLESDELIYRDTAGNEIRREKFEDPEAETASRNVADHHLVPKHGHGYPSERVIYPLQQKRRSLACIEEVFKNVW